MYSILITYMYSILFFNYPKNVILFANLRTESQNHNIKYPTFIKGCVILILISSASKQNRHICFVFQKFDREKRNSPHVLIFPLCYWKFDSHPIIMHFGQFDDDSNLKAYRFRLATFKDSWPFLDDCSCTPEKV